MGILIPQRATRWGWEILLKICFASHKLSLNATTGASFTR
jgi:hypothetical protein